MADGKGLKGNDDVILTVKEGALPNQFVNAWWLTFLQRNFSMHILHTVLNAFSRVLTERICLTIRSSPS